MPRQPAPLCLQIERLTLAYPGQPALVAGWSAQLPAGVTWLQGEAGSGKTSLLRLLAGQLPPPSGRLRLGAALLGVEPAADQARVASSDDPGLQDEALTASLIEARWRRRYPGFDAAAWAQHLAAFGLTPHLAKPMLALSTGSRHKLRLAAALSANAQLTLLDEPTAGLDAPSVRHLRAALDTAHAAALVVVLVAGGLGPDTAPDWPVIGLPLPA